MPVVHRRVNGILIDRAILKIPTLPISYGDAERFLAALTYEVKWLVENFHEPPIR